MATSNSTPISTTLTDVTPRRWRETRIGGQLAAIAEASEETLEVKNRGDLRTDTFELFEKNDRGWESRCLGPSEDLARGLNIGDLA
jgi:hypothetical protein